MLCFDLQALPTFQVMTPLSFAKSFVIPSLDVLTFGVMPHLIFADIPCHVSTSELCQHSCHATDIPCHVSTSEICKHPCDATSVSRVTLPPLSFADSTCHAMFCVPTCNVMLPPLSFANVQCHAISELWCVMLPHVMPLLGLHIVAVNSRDVTSHRKLHKDKLRCIRPYIQSAVSARN